MTHTQSSKYFKLPNILIGSGIFVLLGIVLLLTLTPKAQNMPVTEDTDYLVTNLGDGWSQYTDIPYAFSIDFPSANGERPFVETHSPGNYPDFYSVGFRA